MNHKVKIVEHLIIGHYNWVQDASVKKEIRLAKEMIQEKLKPSQHPGGSKEDNIGKFCISYCWDPAFIKNVINFPVNRIFENKTRWDRYIFFTVLRFIA